MRLVTFHTNSIYQKHSEKLALSALTFGLPVSVYARADQGSWRANVALKPGVILEALKTFQNDDILYIDADAVLDRMPVIDWDEQVQAAAFFDARPNNKKAPCGGTLWFKNSNLMRAAVEEWSTAALADVDSADDWIHLSKILSQFPPHMVKHLEPAWLWYEPTMRSRFPGVQPIVRHLCVGEHNYIKY